MITFQSDFLRIESIEDTNLLKIIWQELSSDMTESDFKDQIQGEKESIEQTAPKGILADTLNFNYTIVPELQTWHNAYLFPVFRAEGVKKLAIIVSQDIFTQISVEQMISDEEDAGFTTCYFDSENAALRWLNH